MKATVGQILVNAMLPEDLRDYSRTITKDSIAEILDQLEKRKDSETYKKVVLGLYKIGALVAESEGSSISLKDLDTPPAIKRLIEKTRAAVAQITHNPKLTNEQKEEAIIKVMEPVLGEIDDIIYKELLKNDNIFSLHVAAGAKGNKGNLRTLVAGDLLYSDHKDRPIPLPVLKSFAEGVDPADYIAGAYGTRKGMVEVKLSTAKTGFFGKQLVQATHQQVITERDCQTKEGIPRKYDDPSIIGTILARNIGDLTAGTLITPREQKYLQALAEKNPDLKVIVRSPITCQAHKGLCAKCAGVREKGDFPAIGDNVGIAAAQALSERLSQGALCLAQGTLVLTVDNGVMPIEKLRPGIIVYGADLLGNLKPTRILNVYNNGIRLCYETTFAVGSKESSTFVSVVSTLDHKFLAVTRRSDAAGVIVPLSIRCRGLKAIMGQLNGYVDSLDSACYAYRVKQRLVGAIHTYDIEVDNDTHLFMLANGLIVSNSAKHKGGIAQHTGRRDISGFDLLNKLVQVPENMALGGTVVSEDGTVEAITEAPQGGYFVRVNKKDFYVPEQYKVTVKVGDTVEAGDVISDGIPNPAEIVKHKGIGEGRRLFTELLYDKAKESGVNLSKRNIELIAHGLINHVEVEDLDAIDGALPGDVVEYSALSKRYKPRVGSIPVIDVKKLNAYKNHYLEKPVLQYSIGTRLTDRVIKDLQQANVSELYVHPDPPPFTPRMVRAMAHATVSPDWAVRFGGSYLMRSLLESVQRGRKAPLHATSYILPLARGTEFGEMLEETGEY